MTSATPRLALLVLVVLVGSVGTSAAATALPGAEGGPSTGVQLEPIENTTDDATDSVENTTNDVTESVDDTADEDAVDDTTGAVKSETTNATGTLESGSNDTLDSSGALAGSVTVGVNGSTATDGADGPGGDTAPSGDSDARTVRSTAAAGGGSVPRRGDGMSAAAGGVAALGVATAAGAALLQRSAAPSSWWLASTGRYWLPRVELPSWLRWLAGLAGYSRYDDSDPLAHDTRQALYRRIEAAPGAYLSALSAEADVPLSTARHHLRVLEAEGLVEAAEFRGKRCFFPASTEHQALEAAMADETQASVLATLAEREWATVSEVADQLDLDASTATYQLQRLAAADLVERRRDGRAVRNRLARHVEPVFDGAPAD